MSFAEVKMKSPDTARNWIVTLHSFYGSSLEAAEADQCFGMFDEDGAKLVAAFINATLDVSGQDCVALAFPVSPMPTGIQFDRIDPTLFDTLVEA